MRSMYKSVSPVDLSLVITNIWVAGTRTWKNIFGQVDGEIEQYRTTLIRLRDDFLARAAVTTEVAVLGIQLDVSNMQTHVSNTCPTK
jgi:hypothetical protein